MTCCLICFWGSCALAEEQKVMKEERKAKDKEEAAEEAETKPTAKKLRARKGAQQPVNVEAEAPAE